MPGWDVGVHAAGRVRHLSQALDLDIGVHFRGDAGENRRVVAYEAQG